jgi:hypothetical protein
VGHEVGRGFAGKHDEAEEEREAHGELGVAHFVGVDWKRGGVVLLGHGLGPGEAERRLGSGG